MDEPLKLLEPFLAKKRLDKPCPVRLPRPMAQSQSETKLVTPVSLFVDAVLVVAFFLYLYSLVSPHVPSNDPHWVKIWGGLAALCMTGVFWLCIQMFRVVFRAHRAANRARKQH